MNLNLNDKVAVIAGASRGIGFAIAQSLASEGCRLLITGRTEETLEGAKDQLASTGANVESLVIDIVSPGASERLRAHAMSVFGGVDIYVGSAGGNRRKPFQDTTDEDWDAIMDVNFNAHIRCARDLLPAMEKSQSASIIFITSIFGREAGGKGLSIYNATKSALISAAKIMAMDLGEKNIRVNTVAPGSIRYPGGSWDKRCIEDPEGMAEFKRVNLPMGRFGRADEVADVVTFLASDRASWISGACINVDGVQSRSLI